MYFALNTIDRHSKYIRWQNWGKSEKCEWVTYKPTNSPGLEIDMLLHLKRAANVRQRKGSVRSTRNMVKVLLKNLPFRCNTFVIYVDICRKLWELNQLAVCTILIEFSFLYDIFAFCSSSSGSRPISTILVSDAFVSTPRKFSHCLYFLLQGLLELVKEVYLMK